MVHQCGFLIEARVTFDKRRRRSTLTNQRGIRVEGEAQGRGFCRFCPVGGVVGLGEAEFVVHGEVGLAQFELEEAGGPDGEGAEDGPGDGVAPHFGFGSELPVSNLLPLHTIPHKIARPYTLR